MTISVIITFLFGIALIWLYAAIRPRFGPGPKTAVIAGAALWVVAYVLFGASLWAAGMFTTRLMVSSIIWGAVEAPVAALAGAWVFRKTAAIDVHIGHRIDDLHPAAERPPPRVGQLGPQADQGPSAGPEAPYAIENS